MDFAHLLWWVGQERKEEEEEEEEQQQQQQQWHQCVGVVHKPKSFDEEEVDMDPVTTFSRKTGGIFSYQPGPALSQTSCRIMTSQQLKVMNGQAGNSRIVWDQELLLFGTFIFPR